MGYHALEMFSCVAISRINIAKSVNEILTELFIEVDKRLYDLQLQEYTLAIQKDYFFTIL